MDHQEHLSTLQVDVAGIFFALREARAISWPAARRSWLVI